MALLMTAVIMIINIMIMWSRWMIILKMRCIMYGTCQMLK